MSRKAYKPKPKPWFSIKEHRTHKYHAGKDIKSHLVLPPTQGRISCHFWQIFLWLAPEDLPGYLFGTLSCQWIPYPYDFQTFSCITCEFSDWSGIHYFPVFPSCGSRPCLTYLSVLSSSCLLLKLRIIHFSLSHFLDLWLFLLLSSGQSPHGYLLLEVQCSDLRLFWIESKKSLHQVFWCWFFF